MTRKDYVKIAEVFATKRAQIVNEYPPGRNGAAYVGALSVWTDLVNATAQMLATDNPSFDVARFMDASGYSD